MFKIYMKSIVKLTIIFTCGNSFGATLDFSNFDMGSTGMTSITVSGATITNLDGNSIYVSNFIGGPSPPTGYCALEIVSGCAADSEIVFSGTISNLTFVLDGANPGDAVEIFVYGGDGLLLGSEFYNEFSPSPIFDSVEVDFSEYGSISRLVFDDSSTHLSQGIGYRDFNFDNDSISPVPIPAASILFLSAIAALARKKTG